MPVEASAIAPSPQGAGFEPGYGDMRAFPPPQAPAHAKGKRAPVAKKRKSGVFVLFTQLVLLLLLLGGGYAMWLAVNNPQGFEELKSLAFSGRDMLIERIKSLGDLLS